MRTNFTFFDSLKGRPRVPPSFLRLPRRDAVELVKELIKIHHIRKSHRFGGTADRRAGFDQFRKNLVDPAVFDAGRQFAVGKGAGAAFANRCYESDTGATFPKGGTGDILSGFI